MAFTQIVAMIRKDLQQFFSDRRAVIMISVAFAMIVFGVRIQGSVAGFIGVSIACALMAATFGLLVAALGNTPATARGVTTFAILIMVSSAALGCRPSSSRRGCSRRRSSCRRAGRLTASTR